MRIDTVPTSTLSASGSTGSRSVVADVLEDTLLYFYSNETIYMQIELADKKREAIIELN